MKLLLPVVLLAIFAVGCKNRATPFSNPFLAPDRVPPPATRYPAPGTAVPYYGNGPSLAPPVVTPGSGAGSGSYAPAGSGGYNTSSISAGRSASTNNTTNWSSTTNATRRAQPDRSIAPAGVTPPVTSDGYGANTYNSATTRPAGNGSRVTIPTDNGTARFSPSSTSYGAITPRRPATVAANPATNIQPTPRSAPLGGTGAAPANDRWLTPGQQYGTPAGTQSAPRSSTNRSGAYQTAGATRGRYLAAPATAPTYTVRPSVVAAPKPATYYPSQGFPTAAYPPQVYVNQPYVVPANYGYTYGLPVVTQPVIQNAPYVSAPYIIDDGCCNPIVEENSYLGGTTSSFTVPRGTSNNTAGRWQTGALARSRMRHNSGTGVRQAQNFSSSSNNGPWASSQVRTASAIQPNSSDQLLSSTADATPRTWARYGHDPNYGRIRGRLEYSKASGLWKIRYIPIDGSTDSYGGSVVINNASAVKNFQPGDFVEARGSLNSTQGEELSYAASYRIAGIRPLAK